jgi:hypothetical protein
MLGKYNRSLLSDARARMRARWFAQLLVILVLCCVRSYNPLSQMPQDSAEAWCNSSLPRNVVIEARVVHGHETHAVEVLQQTPLIVAVRNFATDAECAEINRMTEHWLWEEPRSRQASICGNGDCGCWFDVLLRDHTHARSPLVALSNRTTSLLAALSSTEVDYSRVHPPSTLRVQLYNVHGGDKGAWCAPH